MEQPIKRKRVLNSTKKEWTRVYSIGDFQVCRELFVNTLRISPNRVNTALKKNRLSSLLNRQGIADARGRRKESKKASETVKDRITAPAVVDAKGRKKKSKQVSKTVKDQITAPASN
jgi:hypothetical protein